MSGAFTRLNQPRPWTAWVARIILLAVTLFWLWFAIADGLSDSRSQGPIVVFLQLVLPILLVCLLIICWYLELLGGTLLILAAAYLAWFFGHTSTDLGVLFILEYPVALMGILLIIAWFQMRSRRIDSEQ